MGLVSDESKIQKKWVDNRAFASPSSSEMGGRRKFYMLVMLPYPSGRIHMGHVRNYTLGDMVARFQRMKGAAVCHPLGWDAFGLPAENAAIQHGVHPATWTRQNISDMKAQIVRMGISYDWDREIATCFGDYYRWNQWLFLKMWERGDVFRAERNVNWCEALGTVLANEQVIDGKYERTGDPVVQKPMEQYFLKITKYAEELLSDLDSIDWPDNVKVMQRHWIGRSEGANVEFSIVSPQFSDSTIKVFTTRLDTLYGVSFMALSTEHPLVAEAAKTDPALREFCERIASLSREDRLACETKEGCLTALQALHPFTNEPIPVFAANYVLMDYGSGAVMGVPAHDERDNEFAKKYDLPIVQVIQTPNPDDPWEKGTLVNSGPFNGMASDEAVDAMVQQLGGRAEKAITYKLKDWGLSRQRYWGTPVPTVHCPQHGVQPVSQDQLPVQLPEDITFSGVGPSPLTTSQAFLGATCPKCGAPARRETDTMDTFVDSSWYFLRYLDPKNEQLPFAKSEADAWMPVDLYIGGIEHATAHLVYARYFHKVLRDLGMASCKEPFKKLICQGMVLKDGSKMSKSKGNTVDPDEVIERYGADALRLFMAFAAPIEKEIDWTGFEGIEGATRFLKRVARMVEDHCQQAPTSAVAIPTKSEMSAEEKKLMHKLHAAIKHITDDLEVRYQFNTVVSSLMELLNDISALPKDSPHGTCIVRHALSAFIRLMSPVAPHLAEQLWEKYGEQGFCMHAPWPEAEPSWLETDEQLVVVQINGKVRGRITMSATATEEERKAAALSCPEALPHLNGKEIKKVIIPPGGKLVSIVAIG
ncbi:MAG: leucine--tRNA ligase [Holophagaceae bacterium]|nr:leucine--tRNA ligase [Holophagaceae bacterium]